MANRRFRNLEQKLHSELLSSFPTIKEVITDEKVEGYRHVAITVYDHWLSEKEAFEEFKEMSAEKQKINDDKLHSFICGLTSNYESYLAKFIGRNKKRKVSFRAFNSEVAKNRTLKPLSYLASNVRRFIIIIPSLELIYMEGWDFTHHVYLKNDALIGALKMEAMKSNVYVL
ncbi:hypothetical protein [Undibacterium parvum]|uniref:Uncharacterized protein n=2 Tax=Undibacterium TaxID=401469 RepID=A0A6M4A7N5_9BURK|nr:hypothetical protein [Undibacterium parvum]AZP13308.1 hypothetical protein EJN92_15685 [Undibacterium parvum]QJQ07382.1 hypothetical protein EJG51_017965 [Undibacterium piscinae]